MFEFLIFLILKKIILILIYLGEGIFNSGSSTIRLLREVNLSSFSSFLSSDLPIRGMLTPEEFVLAGDHLVHTCPTWTW